jgi:hypothetical protein
MSDYVDIINRYRFPLGRVKDGNFIPWPPIKCIARVETQEPTWAELYYSEEVESDSDSDSDSDFDDGSDNPYLFPWEYPAPPVSTDGVWREGIDYVSESDSDTPSDNGECAILSDDEEVDTKELNKVVFDSKYTEDSESESDDDEFVPNSAFIDEDDVSEDCWKIRPYTLKPIPDDDEEERKVEEKAVFKPRCLSPIPEEGEEEKVTFKSRCLSPIPEEDEDEEKYGGEDMSSENLSIKMMNADLLNDLAKSNLQPPTITSIV